MERLHAPWRAGYLATVNEPPRECIFCAFPAEGPEAYAKHLILTVQPHAMVMMNRYPYSSGHVMVIPLRHAAMPSQLEAEEWAATCALVSSAVDIVKEVLGAEGVNVGMNLGRAAGAGIEHHQHFHVVPRWFGDTNFMPTIGQTKVIGEALDVTYDRLRPRFAALALP